jgi:hypothetical protein
MKKIKKYTLTVVYLFAGIILTWGVLYFLHRNTGSIPKTIKKQISFTVLETQPKTDWQISPQSVNYNKKAGVLTMTATSSTANLIISEQAVPESFGDVPQLYPTLLNKLNQYQDIQTSVGTVTLTHPKELNGGQTAVAKLRQTLIFVKPNHNLTDSQWKDFFDSAQWD